MDGEKGVKILGVGWNLWMDVFSFVVKEMMIGKFMKRVILLNIFKLYDLLGLVFVVMIKVKIVL